MRIDNDVRTRFPRRACREVVTAGQNAHFENDDSAVKELTNACGCDEADDKRRALFMMMNWWKLRLLQ